MANCIWFYSILAGWSTWQWVFLNFSQNFWSIDTPGCASAVIWNHCLKQIWAISPTVPFCQHSALVRALPTKYSFLKFSAIRVIKVSIKGLITGDLLKVVVVSTLNWCQWLHTAVQGTVYILDPHAHCTQIRPCMPFFAQAPAQFFK